VRAAALDSLWKIGTLNEVVKDLIYVSKNEANSSLRILALKCLSKVNNAEAVNAIVEAIKFDPEWGVRMEAADILGNLESPLAVENLAEYLLICDNESLKRRIAGVLRATDLKRASEVIIPYLKDKDPKVRKSAAEALGYLQSPYGVEELLELMIDEDKEVREAARGALKEIAHNDYGEDVGKWRIWWERNKEYFLKRR
jgi:HEAT repeat protein